MLTPNSDADRSTCSRATRFIGSYSMMTEVMKEKRLPGGLPRTITV